MFHFGFSQDLIQASLILAVDTFITGRITTMQEVGQFLVILFGTGYLAKYLVQYLQPTETINNS